MKKERIYFCNGMFCKKAVEKNVVDIHIAVYRVLTWHFVYLNDSYSFEFKLSEQLSDSELMDKALKMIVEYWEVPNKASDFSLSRYKTRFPNGIMLQEYHDALECQTRLRSLLKQDFIDAVKVSRKLTKV